LNGLDIGDGYVLSVSLADFKKSSVGDPMHKNNNYQNSEERSYFELMLGKVDSSDSPIIEECSYDTFVIRYVLQLPNDILLIVKDCLFH
jgi:hypothetical protein